MKPRMIFDFKIWGPIIIWSAMFLIAFIIKLIAFKDINVFFDIAPEATLWASGVLFSIAESDMVFSRARISTKYKRKTGIIGYEMDYTVDLPDKYDPRDHVVYLYLFVIALATWIINLFLSDMAKVSLSNNTSIASGMQIAPYLYYFLSVFIASIMVVIALRSLRDSLK